MDKLFVRFAFHDHGFISAILLQLFAYTPVCIDRRSNRIFVDLYGAFVRSDDFSRQIPDENVKGK